jgi:hypothetical protein
VCGHHGVGSIWLCQALFGSRRVPQAQIECLEAELTARDFLQSNADPSLWILYGEGDAVLTKFYVGNSMIATRTDKEADALVDLIASTIMIRQCAKVQARACCIWC